MVKNYIFKLKMIKTHKFIQNQSIELYEILLIFKAGFVLIQL